MTKSERHGSLVSTLQKLLADGDTWEWVDAGVYRLKGFIPPEPRPKIVNEEESVSYASLDPSTFSDEEDPLGYLPLQTPEVSSQLIDA